MNTRFIRNIRIDELAVRIDHDLLIAIHGQRVTVGDLVPHSVKERSRTDVSSRNLYSRQLAIKPLLSKFDRREANAQ
jgi:Arc/MetJ family transcription regulator